MSNLNEQQQKLYSAGVDAIERIDWERASKMFEAVNWTWATINRVPNRYDLENTAYSLLFKVIYYNEKYCMTGGISVVIINNKEVHVFVGGRADCKIRE